jgi:molybdopterin molybdotransferase
MLPVDEALARILTRVAAAPRRPGDEVPLASAHGRFLSVDVVAARPLPGVDNSAMDGFAVRAADLPGTLPVVATIAAGQRGAALAAGTAVRIMTGAPLPPGADTVVMLEDSAAAGDGHVTLPAARAGEHVRRQGEDVALGDRVLTAGTRLGAGELGLLAALGVARPRVAPRPRVALLATGDELVAVDQELGPGQVVDSSAYALAAQIRDAGAEPVYLGVARDDRAALVATLRAALGHDALVTTGGVSAGDKDHVRDALAEAGVVPDFWKVAMKPGKPLAFGTAGAVPVFGLPGNPVSSMVAFELFVRPALLALAGAAVVTRPRAPVVLPDGYRKPPGRAHYLRARLHRDGERLIADLHARQGSGMLSSMVGAAALVEIDAALGDIPAGGTAPALLLEAA